MNSQEKIDADSPAILYVVFNGEGAKFASDIRQVAMDHASENAGQFPDIGPWRVQAYALMGREYRSGK